MTFTAATWSLQDIINKVRNITGTPISSTGQSALQNQDIANYINTYYQFVMPFELKEQVNFQPFSFQAIPNQDVYSFVGLTQTGEPMCYVDGFPQIFYQSRDIFFQDWPQQVTSDNVATGNGVTTTFAGTTLAFPIIPGGIPGGAGQFMITDGTQIVTDVINTPFNGSGTLVGNIGAGTNTINYVTGAFSVTFASAPTSLTTIYDKYQGYQPARPQGVLLDSTNIKTTDTITLTFRPIPDQVYQVNLQGFIVQNQLLNTGAVPMQTEWGQLIAYGASVEIFADRGDLAAYNATYPIMKRYENVALGRFVQQLENAQSVGRF